MSSIKVDKSQAYYGMPYLYKDVCMIYPVKVKEVVQIGPETFDKMLQHITLAPEALSDKLTHITSYDFFVEQHRIDSFAKKTSSAMRVFTKEEILIIPDSQIFALGGGEGEDKFRILTPDEFKDIQHIIREFHWVGQPKKTSTNQLASEINLKLARGRATVARIKGEEDESLSFADMLSSLLVGVPSISYEDIWDLSYFAFLDLWQRFNKKERFDIDIRSALAGAKIPAERLKGWIGPLKI